MLSEGVDPNYANEFGETAAHLTAISGSSEILSQLIAAGADVSKPTNGEYAGHDKPVRRTPLMWHVHGDVNIPVHRAFRFNLPFTHGNKPSSSPTKIARMKSCCCQPDLPSVLVGSFRAGFLFEQPFAPMMSIRRERSEQ
jgi:hypothetical protein